MGFIPYSVAEIRRLLPLLGQEDMGRLELHLHWSQWRREHQWQARQAHRRRRARQLAVASLADVSLDPPTPLSIAGLPPLTPARWEQSALLLPPQRPPTGRPAADHRQIIATSSTGCSGS